jgi:hypothetical protein
MTNAINHWLDEAAKCFASQAQKLRLFHQRQIYSEYWVQNEMSALLPWESEGIYIVDCGPPIVLPAGVSKFPDFTLRFDSSADSPLYFIELKDLLTNAATNVHKLREETAVMVKMSRELTVGRWQTHSGKAAQFSASMVEALTTAPIYFCGLAVGAQEDVPLNLPGFKSTIKPITIDWSLGFYELEDAEIAASDYEPIVPEEDNLNFELSDSGINDLTMAVAFEAAHSCESAKTQTAPQLPIGTASDADLMKQKVEAMLRAYNQRSDDPIEHAAPWVWTPNSSGHPKTESGKEFGIEIRFSYNQKPVR